MIMTMWVFEVFLEQSAVMLSKGFFESWRCGA